MTVDELIEKIDRALDSGRDVDREDVLYDTLRFVRTGE